MAEFKLVISDPKEKKAYQVELKSPDADRLFGKRIGDSINGEIINTPGFEFKVTGGSDKQGFPMRADVMGTRRIRVLLSQGPGIKIKRKGERRRKSIRGNQISDDVSQINLKVIKHGKKPLGVALGKEEEATEEKPEEKKEEKPTEEKSGEKPTEEKSEEKPTEEKAAEKKEESTKEEKPVEEKSEEKKEDKPEEKK